MWYSVWRFIYIYMIYYHPVYWLINKARLYHPLDFDNAAWPVLAIFGSATWFLLTRVFAEILGRKHGNMYFWWAFFSVFHFWGLPVYLIYDIAGSASAKKRHASMQNKYGDRSKAEIWASGSQRKPRLQMRRRRR